MTAPRQWADVLPPGVARRQETWERAQRAGRMRALGWTYVAIAARVGVSAERVRQMMPLLRSAAPVNLYLGQGGQVVELMQMLGGRR